MTDTHANVAVTGFQTNMTPVFCGVCKGVCKYVIYFYLLEMATAGNTFPESIPTILYVPEVRESWRCYTQSEVNTGDYNYACLIYRSK